MLFTGGDVDMVEQLLKMNCKLQPQTNAAEDRRSGAAGGYTMRVSLVKVAWRDHGPPMLPMLLSAGCAPCRRDASELPLLRSLQFHERRRTTPMRLQWWARVAVRSELRSGAGVDNEDVEELPLPPAMKRYLAYGEYVN